ncbi:hypothetical protein [Pleionea mediterranea]|uniref:Uncharacterized protein n=1 Tax=Pleionea mediterranea TaxID=523701 RepID=A0A316FY61_9GAMM|nr:hypothetical protein [Pleionea mediterranea]PWK53035.1 hypothetical protein C8D97_104253 [Pleionea mediterranea]
MNTAQRIKASLLKENLCIELQDNTEVSGVVLACFEDYFVISVTVDFHFDGQAFIEYKVVESIVESNSNSFYSKLFFARNKKTPQLNETYSSTFNSLLKSFKSDKIISLEFHNELLMGYIKSVSGREIVIEPISSTGELLESYACSRDELLYVKTDSEYLSVYEEYISGGVEF